MTTMSVLLHEIGQEFAELMVTYTEYDQRMFKHLSVLSSKLIKLDDELKRQRA